MLKHAVSFVAALVGGLCLSVPAAHAVELVPGSTRGVAVFGVSPYGGAPNAGAPTYIGNNFNNRNDVLASPGLGTLGGYLTANPVAANNIRQGGPGPLPGAVQQLGGGNAFGPFGAGSLSLTPTRVGFTLLDNAPGGGSASYGIASWEADFDQQKEAFNGTIGNWLAISGRVTLPGNAAAASLRTFIDSQNPNSPFFGGVDLAPLVLAASNNNAPLLNLVAQGGQGNIVAVPALGTFRGLVSNSMNVVIPAGDQFTVTSTLTIYADPASLDSVGPDALDSLLDDPEFAAVSLPQFSLAGMDNAPTSPVPEPAAAWLLLAGLAMVARLRRSSGG